MAQHFDTTKLLGWTVFMLVYACAWDASVTRMMQMAEPMAVAASDSSPTQRIALFAVGVYAVFRTTLMFLIAMLLIFCMMRALECVLPYVTRPTWIVQPLKDCMKMGYVTFTWANPSFIPFHGAVMCAMVVVAGAYAAVYPTDSDLASPDMTRSVVARAALSMSVVGVMTYAGFALSSIVPAR